ncbi:hypothetical protein [Streptomyces alanosinicus]|uniref:hypothetical protein n=1 Tax=Streptomyces alanosinicus TaxID=68171 RepID=UPI00167B998E|nr:hypothetical protein [Streptomyces alanosinicus]
MTTDTSEETAILLQRAAASFQPLAGEPSPFGPPVGYPLAGEQVPLAGFADEAALAKAVLRRLAPWFHIQREVPGRHPTGRPCRIDAVLRPRDAQVWKNPQVALGVEFKSWDSHVADASRKDRIGWVAQAIDYPMVDWEGYGRLPVFMCPDPFVRNRNLPGDGVDDVGHFVDGLLGQYNLGYLTLFNGNGLTMLMYGMNTVWYERHGVSNGRNWTLRPRTGHRRWTAIQPQLAGLWSRSDRFISPKTRGRSGCL